jgi:lipid A ethanolaminephosphotransferase
VDLSNLISLKRKTHSWGAGLVAPFSGPVSESALLFASAVYLVLFTNKTMLRHIFSLEMAGWSGWLFKLSTVGLAISLMHIVLLLFFVAGVTRVALVFLVFVAAAADFFMGQYGVLVDSDLIASVFETTKTEAGQFLSWQYLASLVLFALAYSVVIWRLRLAPIPWKQRLWQAVKYLAANLLFIGLLGASSYKEYASFFRNNRQVRHMFNPVNSLYETGHYVQRVYFPRDKTFLRIGLDAERIGPVNPLRKRFVVFVLGETARADHFSINGYPKKTNPRLENENLFNFSTVFSCGTATAASVPCLFSNLGRQDFSEEAAASRENVLDLIQRSGYQTTWIDNNTGCKGVCDRVQVIDLSKYWGPELCHDGLCYDEILMAPLRHLANNQGVDHFVVLHMVGSHGPTYSMRYPKTAARFQPECLTNQLIDCSREQVVNTYDNTILYTDKVLGEVIDYLKTLGGKFDTAMFYVSDHGESLGEKGLYLHSLPYALAPDEQKRVPMFLWMSDSYSAQAGLSENSLRRQEHCRLSHDNIFHSLLSLLNIGTREYRPELDVFNRRAPCKE